MIGVLFNSAAAQAGQLVLAAFRRSVTATQARSISRGALRASTDDVIVAVDIPDAWGEDLLAWLRARPRKLLVFGRMPAVLAAKFGLRVDAAFASELAAASRSEPAPTGDMRASRAAVDYTALATTVGGDVWHRPFERFDFTDEWNNLGYGAIRCDGSIWSIAQAAQAASGEELARVRIDGTAIGSYAALWDSDASSVLWFNRAIGPIDSFEWRIVERFLSTHRADTLPLHPVLSEVPWGYDAAITSRLDCDEDVEAARPLWDAYRRMNVPFSLAVHTQNLHDSRHYSILRELLADGGAVLSHTATHAPNWGGSYDAALVEGLQSADLIRGVTGQTVRYAVSPFHQSPPYALRALADAGYEGCIGGIIRNDPEFLIARGGELAGLPSGFVGHSQQCMLHGDCMLASDDPLAVYKQAFDFAYQTRTLFGYLDHPFSERYQYGWRSEAQRIDAHEQLVAYIRAKARKPLFMTEEAALDFLAARAGICIVADGDGMYTCVPTGARSPFTLGVEWRGEQFELVPGMMLS
ncbi:polysaccharide deacetylase family protein [Burkholderia multivorans]|uniref:polysaccharide deacetylase family protein n=1 Tax=Burkholderia multivorans TaxID=87883 RepID=UPI002018C791|nr:polysaccharide deacetylase family protein [Burkholderia multivorans]MCO1371845.1 polysaccharide deacetylase family protein [Burkholderia multivorans]MCO1456903.1 polysaccharide deacetylase family protein [Burkholderia multivorans]MCO1465894.1 polysaccharide deacetylase family protein [Burkholderia multivorans]UQO16400.1 polysaccharide deacetylase family protein [Burkholderia multivorans]UQO86228.1 polysaccharide deacetylase family protein [Burkholderia multivorans]